MYIVAQRVQSPVDKQTGVNSLLHLHDLSAPLNWDDIEYISSLLPGRLASESVELPRGGNRVLSYLEAAGPDSTTRAELEAAIDACAGDVAASPSVVRRTGSIAVRFLLAYRPAMHADDVRSREFESLRSHILDLYERPHTITPSHDFSVTLFVRRVEDGHVLWLGPTSRRHLETILHIAIPDAKLHLTTEIQQDLAPRVEHILPALVNVPISKLPGMKQVVLKSDDTGEEKIVWEAA